MIPDEAVEAAARMMLDKMYDDKTLRVDDEDRDIMRAALEAAAPHMLGRVQVGDVEVIAPDVTRVGDSISYNGRLYVRTQDPSA